MGTKVTNVSAASTGIKDVPITIRFAGEQYVASIQIRDSDNNPVDTTGQTITARAGFYTAQTTETQSGENVNIQFHTTPVATNQRLQDITVNTVNASMGQYSYVVPEDLWDGDIAFNEDHNTPIVIIFFYKSNPTTTPATKLATRRIILFRRGSP